MTDTCTRPNERQEGIADGLHSPNEPLLEQLLSLLAIMAKSSMYSQVH